MSTIRSIDFFLRGKVSGVDLTPRTIGLSQFNEFNQQVEAFLAGSQKGKLNETHVEIGEGSYKLRVILTAATSLALETDFAVLTREDSLGEIDPKRAEVIAKPAARGAGANNGIRVRQDYMINRMKPNHENHVILSPYRQALRPRSANKLRSNLNHG